jgi:hypothetical protein
MALFARLCNPDWSGQTLSALVTDLYDSLDAEVPSIKACLGLFSSWIMKQPSLNQTLRLS